MTVAAVILAAPRDSALADADGTPAVRRVADTAWAGGATPVVVVGEPDPALDAALATAEAAIAPADPAGGGPAAHLRRGLAAAIRTVAGTDAVLAWPARMAWVDAETVTTLLAAHGADREAVLRPVHDGEAGWPALLPLRWAAALGDDPLRSIEGLVADLAAAGAPVVLVDTGDPGVTHDVAVPSADLPAWSGPPEPDGPAPDWGAAVADLPDDAVPAPRRAPA